MSPFNDFVAMQDVLSPTAFYCLDCRAIDWSEGIPWTRDRMDELGETSCMGCGKRL